MEQIKSRETIHCFTLSSGAQVWRVIDHDGEKLIQITIDTPENAITLSLKDAAMLAMLATDMYNGIMRRIDRPKSP